MSRRIFVVGATGAQGLPICKSLVEDGAYSLRILTRNPNSRRVQEIQALAPDVEIIEGTFASEADLRRGFAGCWGAFVNIDGFNCGEKNELFWGIRSYELALQEGVQFFVWGNLDYALKMSGYDSAVRAGHIDGKGRVGEWIRFQTLDKTNPKALAAATFTTGPYVEMNFSSHTIMTPQIAADGTVTWMVPLGEGAIPFVALDDCGPYVRWLFDHPERARGMDLAVSIDHLTYDDIVDAFVKVTGHPARWVDVPMDAYFKHMPFPADRPAAYNADPEDTATMTFQQNFSGFWNIFRQQRKEGNRGWATRDYALMDEVLPTRIRTAEELVRREDEKRRAAGQGGLWESLQAANIQPVLKLGEDGGKGRL